MSKEAFQDLLLLMDFRRGQKQREREREREREPPRQLWRWKSRGKRTWEMRRGHTVPHEEVHIIKPNLDDDQDDNGDHSAVEAGGSWQPEAG